MSDQPAARDQPDMNALIACARHLASILRVAVSSDAEVANHLHYILFTREVYSAACEGLITKDEAVIAVLQRLETWLIEKARVPYDVEGLDYRPVVPELYRALFSDRL